MKNTAFVLPPELQPSVSEQGGESDDGGNVMYLSECIFDFLPAIDFEFEWESVKPIASKHPWLCWQGYFRSENHYRRSTRNSHHNIEHWNDKVYLDQIYRARYWLSLLTPSPRFNRRHNSYALKHYCERWWHPYVPPRFEVCSGYTSVSSYVSNGCLILAALSLGWKFSSSHRGRSTCLNLDFPFFEKSLRYLCPEERFLF